MSDFKLSQSRNISGQADSVLEMGIEPNPNRTNRTRTLFFERTEEN